MADGLAPLSSSSLRSTLARATSSALAFGVAGLLVGWVVPRGPASALPHGAGGALLGFLAGIAAQRLQHRLLSPALHALAAGGVTAGLGVVLAVQVVYADGALEGGLAAGFQRLADVVGRPDRALTIAGFGGAAVATGLVQAWLEGLRRRGLSDEDRVLQGAGLLFLLAVATFVALFPLALRLDHRASMQELVLYTAANTLGQVVFLAGMPVALCQPLLERSTERAFRPRACPTSS